MIARISKTVTLPANENIAIQVCVPNFRENGTFLFQPLDQFVCNQKVLCLPVLTECRDGKVQVYMFNTRATNVQLYKNTKLGQLISVEPIIVF